MYKINSDKEVCFCVLLNFGKITFQTSIKNIFILLDSRSGKIGVTIDASEWVQKRRFFENTFITKCLLMSHVIMKGKKSGHVSSGNSVVIRTWKSWYLKNHFMNSFTFEANWYYTNAMHYHFTSSLFMPLARGETTDALFIGEPNSGSFGMTRPGTVLTTKN